MQVKYSVTQQVLDVIFSLGRTEDIRFSPRRRRLAIAAFTLNKIAILAASVPADGKDIRVTEANVMSSPFLRSPHGVDFIDEETIIVANRDGDACIFRLPVIEDRIHSQELIPVAEIRSGEVLHTPGSVCVTTRPGNVCEALICNNYGDFVTRHWLDLASGSQKNEILLRKQLSIPDGICVSTDTRWIAVSNHGTQSVLIYENVSELNEHSDPVATLRGSAYPHGLRFAANNRLLIVADAGAPYLHIYADDGSGWRGERNPITSLRVMKEEAFLYGRYNPQQGGPKGIDVHDDLGLVVTTCETQPLAFFVLRSTYQNHVIVS